MRSVSLYLGVPAALAMMAVSMGCNWLYLSGFGKTPGVVALLSAASIAIDVLKALAPFWLSEAWKGVHVGRGIAALVVLVFCVAVSTASALGFLAETHTASVGGRQAVNDRHLAAGARLEDLQTQLAQVAKAHAVAVVEAAIAAGRHDVRWISSKGCTKDTAQSSREFCREQGGLEGKLKAAREAARLRGQIAETNKTLEALKAEGGGQDADPRGSSIGRFTGLSAADVNYAIELCMAVLVEFSAAFGLFLALEGAKDREPPPPATVDPKLEVVLAGKRKGRKKAGQERLMSPRRIRFGGKDSAPDNLNLRNGRPLD
jgi:hypothetical protein